MHDKRPVVVLLREARVGRDPYIEAFGRVEGCVVACVPVLEAELVNAEQLDQRVARPDSHAGMVLTSKRAVQAVAESLARCGGADQDSPIHKAWKDRVWMAVGEATAQEIVKLGFEAQASESGTGEALAHAITARFGVANNATVTPAPGVGLSSTPAPIRNLPLLFPCGEKRHDAIPKALAAAGIPLSEIVVYQTSGNQDLFQTGLRATLDQRIDQADGVWFVFFSPSGVDTALSSSLSLVQSLGVLHLLRFAAIGPTTASHLARQLQTFPDPSHPGACFAVSATAPAPNADSLLVAMSQWRPVS
ncbi:hypothetical protein CAOG_01826 [Capsaspora owczarzaki ATCC 30864]|uniref:Tetrapyrrole biosynthesis uroporphyrinogen III synthase domain-containing protein n=1 Tax=Capsaspora owczarzaki (strain ATCC 30864) TaxID=595528 RepID=A0A0D2U5W5_CAPO3|nr:hypothetical protein CAOG_01826 [Capsaspora owczarzaki ATCC 30864]KJE90516.1 hypothetical protein CAOG_001826 [Capsaspora owczarzaki ATCC 30864]|eukprot:XP_004364694.1 hypothetical protein CAOG_01826 [Capsaspora owczarzaki ATCC 30864]